MLTSSQPSKRAGRSAASSKRRPAVRRAAHAVDRYARAVTDGTVVAGPLVRAACRRHLADRRRRAWVFDEARADHAIDFFEQFLRLPDLTDAWGDPRPFTLAPWQQFIIGSLFGWVDKRGLRRFRDAYIEVGKGNGKSPMAAGIGLYGLLMDHELAAEIYAAAVTREQASILWRDAQRIIEASPALVKLLATKRLELMAGNIAYKPTGAWFRPLSSEHRGLDGKRPHMGLIDELHEHATPIVTTKIRAGAKGRQQPLFVEITNSGVDRTSICWHHHEHSRKVVEGTVEDDRWFAYVCALDPDDDPLADPSCWVKANPNLGVAIQRDYLERQVETALNIQSETNTVLRLNFCVWTQAISRAIDAAQWQACAAAVDDAELAGVPCYAGLDLGQRDDFTAFVLVWTLPDGRVVVRPTFWLPSATLEKKRDRPYAQWQRSGELEVTDGDTTHYALVEETIIAQCARWGVHEIAYDPNYASQVAQDLQGAGLTMVPTPQGFKLNEAILKLEELLAAGRLCHGGHQVLGWMADNLVVKTGTKGDKRPDKPSSREKIDGMVALLMALDRVVRQPSDNVYASRPLLVLGD